MHGEGAWSVVAKHFPGRIGKQCRERWHNQLRPDIRRDAWTDDEEMQLIAAHRAQVNIRPCETKCNIGVKPV